MRSIGLIPRNRLKKIPTVLRVKHEYCFFLHDECARIIKEYEDKKADEVKFKFRSQKLLEVFEKISKEKNTTEALIRIGLEKEAKKFILNRITMAMVSDCLHHIFEGLKCLEKRKTVVALNVLRKPIKDNLLYLAWMLGDQNAFYEDFMAGNPENLTQKKLGNVRIKIFSKAIKVLKLTPLIEAQILNELIYDKKSLVGLEELFQHAVHLVTIQNIELRTEPQSFNFIFHDFREDEIYHIVYGCMPYILLFMSHVIVGLFHKMKKMDKISISSFWVRSLQGFHLVEGNEDDEIAASLGDLLSTESITCDSCGIRPKVTKYNATRIILAESFRCSFCKRINPFPFSWRC